MSSISQINPADYDPQGGDLPDVPPALESNREPLMLFEAELRDARDLNGLGETPPTNSERLDSSDSVFSESNPPPQPPNPP
jgi:hypothetical protein